MITHPPRTRIGAAFARLRLEATATLIGQLLCASAALAAGGAAGSDKFQTFSSGDAAAPPADSAASKTCDKGMVWDKRHKKCVVKHGGVLPDYDLTEYAYALARADRYQEAIDILDMLQDPNTARALNYRGYATRKLGRTEEGIGYYLRSVALDPTYAQVREYLGEAYVTLGKFELAKEQLATIQKLCGGAECEEYDQLATAIDRGKLE
jgi:tetratricopeptide (TPR) repeat protein